MEGSGASKAARVCHARHVRPKRAAGQFDPQGQHQNAPRLALRSAPRTARHSKARARDHPTHPARTMPLLRWPHARHRDLPPRTKTNVARTTTGAGRMTHRLSHTTERHRSPTADPVTSGCAQPSSTRNLKALTPDRSAFPGSSGAFALVSGNMHSLSRSRCRNRLGTLPIGRPKTPRGFLLPRFVNVGRQLLAANVVPRPTSKNLQESRR